jgi:anti-sigma factor RsiW
MYTSSHPSFDRLVDLVENRLSHDEQAQAQAHIGTCQHCAGTLARVRRVVGLMRHYDAVDTPPHVIAGLVPLLRQRRQATSGGNESAPGWRQRIVAALRFDSLRQPGLSLRTGQLAARQVLFDAGQYDVDVRIAPSANAWTVSGQVLGPRTGGQVELRGPAAIVQTELNALNRFLLPPIPAGRYMLSLRLDTAEVEIADLEVGS